MLLKIIRQFPMFLSIAKIVKMPSHKARHQCMPKWFFSQHISLALPNLSKYGLSNLVTILGVESISFLEKVCLRWVSLPFLFLFTRSELASDLFLFTDTEGLWELKELEASMMTAAARVKLSDRTKTSWCKDILHQSKRRLRGLQYH